MKTDDIMKYVTNTPYNSNPSVIKSMVNTAISEAKNNKQLLNSIDAITNRLRLSTSNIVSSKTLEEAIDNFNNEVADRLNQVIGIPPENIGEHLQIEKSVYIIPNSAWSTNLSFKVKAHYENDDLWPYVAIYKGYYDKNTDFSHMSNVGAEVYCYLDEWLASDDTRRSGGHGSLQNVEFDLTKIYDGYNNNHLSNWNFPTGYYTLVLFATNQYSPVVEVVHFYVQQYTR